MSSDDRAKRGTYVLKLSAESVKARKWIGQAEHSGRNVLVWDGGHPDTIRGFGLKVTPAGNRSLLLQYWSPLTRERRRITKPFEALTVDQARTLARDYRNQIANGRDPFMELKQQRDLRIAEHEQTVAKLVTAYLADVEDRLKARTFYERSRILRTHIVGTFGDRPIASLTKRDIRKLHKSIGATSRTTANHVVEMLRMFAYWCANDMGCAMPSPDALFKGFAGKHGWKYPEEARERFLSLDEYTRLGQALTRAELKGLPIPERLRLSDEQRAQQRAKRPPRKRGPYKIKKEREPAKASPISIGAIRFAALSGWRESEVLSLRWDAIDWAHGIATLRETKTGRSYRTLGKAAAELLSALPKVDGSPFVFPGARQAKPGEPSKPEHLKELKWPWYSALDAAQVTMRFHDLRHSFASQLAGLGYSELVIGELLGHRKRTASSATSRYTHLSNEVLREAADRVSALIWSAMRGEHKPTSAKVLPMRRSLPRNRRQNY